VRLGGRICEAEVLRVESWMAGWLYRAYPVKGTSELPDNPPDAGTTTQS
jgi:hypothetical protein